MSKSIKVSQDVYDILLNLQRPRETFSETISRLLMINALVEKVLPFIREQRVTFEAQVAKYKDRIESEVKGGKP